MGINIHQTTVSRCLKRLNTTRKRAQRVAAQRDEVLRDAWLAQLSQYLASQLVFVDETASDLKTTHRKWAWSPRGCRAPIRTHLQSGRRYSILPAYTTEGYIAHMVEEGSITGELFNRFIIEQVLPLCNGWPEPRSVICLDNASIHKSEVRITPFGLLMVLRISWVVPLAELS